MGNTESQTSIKQVNDNLTVNQNSYQSDIQQINKQVSETTIESAKSCSASLNNNQAIVVKGLTVKGDLNLSSKQTARAAVTFSCVNGTDIRQKAGSNMIANILDNIADKNDTEILQKLDANAKAAAEQQFGGIGQAKTGINTDTTNINKTINSSYVNIKKLVQNVVENKFQAKTVDACISEVKNNQEIAAVDITVGGKADIVFEQDAAAELVTSCIQNSSIGTDVLSTVASELGVKIDRENRNVTTQENKTSAESTAKNKGVFEGAGSAVESIGKAYSGVITSILGEGGIGGMMSSPGGMIFSIVSCIIIIIALGVAAMMYMP